MYVRIQRYLAAAALVAVAAATPVLMAAPDVNASKADLERDAVRAYREVSVALSQADSPEDREAAVREFAGVMESLKDRGLTLDEFIQALGDRGLADPAAVERLMTRLSELRTSDPDALQRMAQGDISKDDAEAFTDVLAGPEGATYGYFYSYWYYYFACFGVVSVVYIY